MLVSISELAIVYIRSSLQGNRTNMIKLLFVFNQDGCTDVKDTRSRTSRSWLLGKSTLEMTDDVYTWQIMICGNFRILHCRVHTNSHLGITCTVFITENCLGFFGKYLNTFKQQHCLWIAVYWFLYDSIQPRYSCSIISH